MKECSSCLYFTFNREPKCGKGLKVFQDKCVSWMSLDRNDIFLFFLLMVLWAITSVFIMATIYEVFRRLL